RELQDRRQLSFHFRRREAEDRGVQGGVVAAGELWMKAGAQLENGRDGPLRLDRAARRPRDAAQELEKRALAGAVLTDDADRLAALDLERHVLQRGEHRMSRAPREELDQPIGGPRIDVV